LHLWHARYPYEEVTLTITGHATIVLRGELVDGYVFKNV